MKGPKMDRFARRWPKMPGARAGRVSQGAQVGSFCEVDDAGCCFARPRLPAGAGVAESAGPAEDRLDRCLIQPMRCLSLSTAYRTLPTAETSQKIQQAQLEELPGHLERSLERGLLSGEIGDRGRQVNVDVAGKRRLQI